MPNSPSDSKPSPDLRHWPQIKAFFAGDASSDVTLSSGRKRVRNVVRNQDFGSPGGSAKYAEIAILAAILDPTVLKSSNPGPALPQAAALIENVPKYLHVGFEKLSTEEMKTVLFVQAQRRDAEDADWDRDIPPYFTFSEAVNENWCRFKTEKRLTRFMKQQSYPERYFPYINIAAYQIAEKRERAAKQDSERIRKQKARSKKERKTKSPLDKKPKLPDKNA
jgi:hypothetical protein